MKAALTIALMSAFPYRPPGEPRALDWIKADLHLHTAEDPLDVVNYSALELLERAHAKGFRVLAITLHDAVFHDERVFARARELGILLVPAVERRIEGADVVLLNITREEADALTSFDDLRQLRKARGASLLTFAPHPFYRLGGSIGHRINDHLDCFDAVEQCHLHIPLLDPNRTARRLAHRHNKPFLATSDSHRTKFFGHHYSYLGVTSKAGGLPAVTEVFNAIRAHRIQRIAPVSWWRTLAVLFFILVQHPVLVRLPRFRRDGDARTALPAVTSLPYGVANERAVI